MQITAANISTLLKAKFPQIKLRVDSASKLTVFVDTNRLKELERITESMADLGAVADRNLSGSSIGGVRIDRVKIFVKTTGRTSGGLDVELAAMQTLQDCITRACCEHGSIAIRLRDGKIIKDITAVKKTPGTPKSDFYLTNASNIPLLHISHKKGRAPSDFQQWGGITEDRIAADPEVRNFVEQCKAKYPNGMSGGDSISSAIQSDHVKRMAVYGINYKESRVDPNAVSVCIQGDPGIQHINNGVYNLTASGSIHYNPEIPSGGYTPVLAAVYKGDRSQFGIRGARFSIYTRGGRKFKEEL